jgi:hypothetical protein
MPGVYSDSILDGTDPRQFASSPARRLYAGGAIWLNIPASWSLEYSVSSTHNGGLDGITMPFELLALVDQRLNYQPQGMHETTR